MLLNINPEASIEDLRRNLLHPFKPRFSTNHPNRKEFAVNVEDEEELHLENIHGREITFDSANFVCSETLLFGVREKNFYRFDIDSFSFKKLNITGDCPILISNLTLLKLVDVSLPTINSFMHFIIATRN